MGGSGIGELITGAACIGASAKRADGIGALATSVLGTMISEFPTSACGRGGRSPEQPAASISRSTDAAGPRRRNRERA
ncbi:hypothetical protein OHAE_1809 [Ochrobactrum soli]|uniref:Uncharacterized protein n=1 Tax=Ochrobactrum soli TaxID=2448455 RepID=A0A2P9HPC0_9HYPH|nr:hypothetical protein OHAE_1809 [[Ochrobactrum] soli]